MNKPAEVKVDGMVPLLLVYWLVPRSIPVTPNTYAPDNDAPVNVPVAVPWPMASPAVEAKRLCYRSVVGFDEFYVA